MVPRKEALAIVRNLREAVEKQLDRTVKRSAKEAEKKASTDLNSAVANGQFPYAQDRDGYPEWAFYLLHDIYPDLIEGERGAGESVKYGKRAEIALPEKYAALIMLADLRSVLRGTRKVMSSPLLTWSLFATACDSFDLTEKRLAAVAEPLAECRLHAEDLLSDFATSPPDPKSAHHEVKEMIKQLLSIEDARAKKLRVFDLTKPPFSS